MQPPVANLGIQGQESNQHLLRMCRTNGEVSIEHVPILTLLSTKKGNSHQSAEEANMKSTRTWLWIAGSVVMLSGGSLLSRAWPNNNNPQETNLPGLMLAKLASTQRVVTGLVSKNFGEIKRGAKDMMNICDATQWESHPDPLYGHYKTELRRQASKLTELADQQNLDGAAFNYIQTISTCVSCHVHCRDVLRIAAVPNRVIQIPVAEEEFERSGMPIFRR